MNRLIDPQHLLKDREFDTFYNEQIFDQSLTFNQWVPMTCTDIKSLDSFKHHYGRDPRFKAYSERFGPFFFKNHPINYVVISGWCVGFSVLGIGGKKSYKFLIDDGSGTEIEAFKSDPADVLQLQYKSFLNKFIEIKGQLEKHGIYDITVTVRDLAVISDFRDQMVLFREVIQLREEVLTKSWHSKEAEELYEKTRDEVDVEMALKERNGGKKREKNEKMKTKNWLIRKKLLQVHETQNPIDLSIKEPTAFCSLARGPSILQSMPTFVQSILNDLPTAREKTALRSDTVRDKAQLEVFDSALFREDSVAGASEAITDGERMDIDVIPSSI